MKHPKLKFASYTGALLLCLLLSAHAQSMAQARDSSGGRHRWSAEGRADKMSDKLERQLNLSKEQGKQIHAINTDITRRRDAIRGNTALSKKDRMQQEKALNEERGQRFKSVLTPSQYKKWNDWEMKRKEHLEAKMDKKQERRGVN